MTTLLNRAMAALSAGLIALIAINVATLGSSTSRAYATAVVYYDDDPTSKTALRRLEAWKQRHPGVHSDFGDRPVGRGRGEARNYIQFSEVKEVDF